MAKFRYATFFISLVRKLRGVFFYYIRTNYDLGNFQLSLLQYPFPSHQLPPPPQQSRFWCHLIWGAVLCILTQKGFFLFWPLSTLEIEILRDRPLFTALGGGGIAGPFF